jgi:hypothetical protein
MPITLNGTTGITTPGLINTGSTTFVDLTTTGNTILGDASTDTLNVANGNLVLNSSGNLGVGTASPSFKLDVSGTARITGITRTPALYGTTTGITEFMDSLGTTGMYVTGAGASPSNSIRFYSTGTLNATLDSSGNLGLGVTPTNNTLGKTLQVGQAATWTSETGSNRWWLSSNWYYNSGDKYINNGFATLYSQQSGTHQWSTSASGTAGNAITFNTSMTLDASGNLGVGTTSPGSKLEVQNGYITSGTALSVSGSKILAGYYSNGSLVTFGGEQSNGGPVLGYGVWPSTSASGAFVSSTGITVSRGAYTIAGNSHIWRSGASQTVAIDGSVSMSEVMRIDTSGNLLVGTTSSGVYAGVISRLEAVTSVSNNSAATFKSVSAGQQTISVWNASSAGTIYFMEFSDGTTRTTRGSITSNGTSTAYNTSSDYRLKNTIAPMTGALAKVALLKPCTYKWNADGSDGQGFIAHELAEVVPQCVTGEKDAIDANGKIKPQSIDTSFLVATLTAAIQELKAELDSVKSELATIKGAA